MSKIKKQLLGLIGIIVLCFAIAISVSFIIAYLNARQDWISATIGSLGNIIGGVIGGFVAYFVAAFQIEKGQALEERKQKIKIENLLLLVKEELQHNQRIISAMASSGVFEPKAAKEQITMESWDKFKLEGAVTLSNERFSRISSVFRKLKIVQFSESEDIDVPRMQRLLTELKECELLLQGIGSQDT